MIPGKMSSSSRPSVLVLVLDALRAHNLSMYGYEKRTAPRMEEFAADATLFRHAYTNATWTIPSHASMLSGLYLSQHRIESIERNRRFNPSIVPLPVALGENGYRTVAFSHNPLFSPAHHFDYFDEFYSLQRNEESLSSVQTPGILNSHGLAAKLAAYRNKAGRPRSFFNQILKWMANQEQPFFVMANLLNIHYPWTPPWRQLLTHVRFNPALLVKGDYTTLRPFHFNSGLLQITDKHRQVWKSLYDASIAHVDREFGRFIGQLKTWQGWDELIIIVMSDHGEMLGEQDVVGHTLTLHDNLMRVPLIIKHPEYQPGLVVDDVVQTLDLYPSVLGWTKSKRDDIPDAQLQRPSYSAAMDAPGRSSGFAVAEEDYTDSYDVIGGLLDVNPDFDVEKYPRSQAAMHVGSHKYISRLDKGDQLFDLRTDPSETRNLIDSAEYEPVRQRLRDKLTQWRAGLGVFPPQEMSPADDYDDEMASQLRALGYLA